MEDQKNQLVAKLKEAQNVLVTVSKNPSVDQLSAAIGLTLALNKLDKHATAVYSGETPSTLEFLRPEETLEATTDSLRDFIISLDKSKADKLRYKVEDEVVRIFITPYHTAISEKDLEYSQGDFNVDIVVALGVHEQQDLDDAIQAHGRILHDATVATLSTGGQSELGAINVVDTAASSLAEMAAVIVDALSKDALDEQIATAFLTGIVSMTDRFGNDRTTPQTMSVSSKLMAAGANQQLVAAELTAPEEKASETDDQPEVPSSEVAEETTEEPAKQPEPGTLEIHHEPGEQRAEHTHHDHHDEPEEDDLPEPDRPADVAADEQAVEEAADQTDSADTDEMAEDDAIEAGDTAEKPEQEIERPQIQVHSDGKLLNEKEAMLPPVQTSWAETSEPQAEAPEESYFAHERVIEPPSRSGTLTANTLPEAQSASVENLTRPVNDTPLLSHNAASAASPQSQPSSEDTGVSIAVPTPPAVAPTPSEPLPPLPQSPVMPSNFAAGGPPAQDTVIDTTTQTLTEIEKAVDSPHAGGSPQQQAPVETESSVDDARNAVDAALRAAQASQTAPGEPIIALNAQPLGDPLHESPVSEDSSASAPALQPAPGFGQGENTSGSTFDNAATLSVPQLDAHGMSASPSSFPGRLPSVPSSGDQVDTQPAPPPVPPPPVFPAV